MTATSQQLTVTLAWLQGDQERTATIVCEDSTPRELLPILVSGCRLPQHDAHGAALAYALRLGAGNRPALQPGEPIGAQGVRDGCRLWLTEASPVGRASRPRCLLSLPDGVAEIVVPPGGLAITRTGLLRALELLAPAAYSQEIERLERRRSAYRFVSNRQHCTILADNAGAWCVHTDRADVITLLDGVRLRPGIPAPAVHGGLLTPGEGGPGLTLHLLTSVT